MQSNHEERRRMQASRAARNRRDSVFSCTNRAMKSDVTITLDKSTYTSGDLITGTVSIVLTQEIKVKELNVQIIGHGHVSWNEQRTYTKFSAPSVSRKMSETYVDHVILLVNKDKPPPTLATNKRTTSRVHPTPARDGQEMMLYSSPSETDQEDSIFVHPGEYTFHFEYNLPVKLPSSFEGKWGFIRYAVKCVLVRPWKFNIEREHEFTLNSLVDLNDEPDLVRPMQALGEFHPGLVCFNQELVNVEVRVGRRGFASGEYIPCYVEIENNTRHKLHSLRLTLQQIVTFRVGKKTKKVTQTLGAINKGELASWQTVTWDNETLTVPRDLPPSTGKSVRSIQIKYMVTLHVKYSSWHDEYTLPLNIVLGTKPFKKSIVYGYLNLLGYNITPRASPATTPLLGQCRLKPSDKMLALSNRSINLNANLPGMMTRDQLDMRRASAFPGLSLTPHTTKSQQCVRTDSTASTVSNGMQSRSGSTNNINTNLAVPHSSVPSLATSRLPRGLSSSHSRLAGSDKQTNHDIIVTSSPKLSEAKFKSATHKKDKAYVKELSGHLIVGDPHKKLKHHSHDAVCSDPKDLDPFDDVNTQVYGGSSQDLNKSLSVNLDAIQE